MLAIRLQRTGRAGHAQFRLIVQDSRYNPSSGRVVALVGHYDPHSKKLVFKGDELSKFLDNGAQPSDRVAKLLKKEGVKLPNWVKLDPDKKRAIKNPDKLRRNRPAPVESAKPAPTESEHSTGPAGEPSPAQTSPGKVSAGKPEKPAEAAPEAETVAEAPAGEETLVAEPPAEPVAEEAPPAEEASPETKPEEALVSEAEAPKEDAPTKPDKTS